MCVNELRARIAAPGVAQSEEIQGSFACVCMFFPHMLNAQKSNIQHWTGIAKRKHQR